MAYLDLPYETSPDSKADAEVNQDEEHEALLQPDQNQKAPPGEVAAGDEDKQAAAAKKEEEEKKAKEYAPSMIPNKHESLFCCKRKGVRNLVINATQFFYTVIVIYFSNKLSMLLTDDVIGIALGFLGYILAVYAWFWIMPDMLDAYVVSTSVEMMKNRECVNKVIM